MKIFTKKESESYSDIDGGKITLITYYMLGIPFWIEEEL